jgi:hypothetical protein
VLHQRCYRPDPHNFHIQIGLSQAAKWRQFNGLRYRRVGGGGLPTKPDQPNQPNLINLANLTGAKTVAVTSQESVQFSS